PGHPHVESAVAQEGVASRIEEEDPLLAETLGQIRIDVVRDQDTRATAAAQACRRWPETGRGQLELELGLQVEVALRMSNPNLGIDSVVGQLRASTEHLELEALLPDRLCHLVQEVFFALSKVGSHRLFILSQCSLLVNRGLQ